MTAIKQTLSPILNTLNRLQAQYAKEYAQLVNHTMANK